MINKSQHQLFSLNETYAIIRFIATEYAYKYGTDSILYVYMYKNIPTFISTTKIYIVSSEIKILEMKAKHIMIACLFEEYSNVSKLAMVLTVNRLLAQESKLEYAKKIGVDISTYSLIESGFYTSKGAIERNKEIVYQFDPETILEKLEIPIKELKCSFGGEN